MATFDYAALLTDVRALVQDFGRQVTLRKYDRTPADANKPWRGATDPRATATEATVWAVSVPPSGLNELGIEAVADEEALRRVTEILICEPGDDDPDNLDTYDEVVDGSVLHIEYACKLKPASVTMLYFIGVKR